MISKELKNNIISMIFIGSLWQLEIAKDCLLNGWQFKYFFNALVFDDVWAVSDFWMFLLVTCWIALLYINNGAVVKNG